MIGLDRIDQIINNIKEKEAPDHLTWRMEIDDEVKENSRRINAQRTIDY